MADVANILFALGLPFLTGAFFVMALGRTNRPGHGALVAGLGFPLGLVCVIGGYLVLGNWGPGLHLWGNMLIQLVLLVVFAVLAWWRWRASAPQLASLPAVERFADLSKGGRWLIGLLLTWLVVRWLGILVEVAHRPLFPWDAWNAYGIKAKVWFYHPQLDVFAGGWRWFEMEGPAWSASGRRHPPGIGLIQLWLLQLIGRYDDALMNLAWPVALASIGLTLFGALRMVGGDLLVSIGMAAAVVTLPAVNVQAVLAGYGDIWIALYLLLAVIGGLLAQALGLKWIIVTMAASAGMLMIKETSWLWLPVLVFGLACAWVRLRWLAVLGAFGFLGFYAFLWLYGEPIRVSTLGQLGFSRDGFVFPKKINLDAWSEIVVWPELFRHMFVYRNWHLFWYLMPIFGLASLWYARSQRVFAMGAVVAWGGLGLLLGFFSFSTLGNAVIDGTSVNRLLLHLVPTIALLSGLVLLQWKGWLDAELQS